MKPNSHNAISTTSVKDHDLPAYTVRISDRAKYVSLSLSMETGLEVVIPCNYDHRKIPELIQQKREWIARNQRKLHEREAFLQSQDPHLLPDSLNLRSLQQQWQIEYIPTASKGIQIKENKSISKLMISGNVNDIHACKFFLKKWLMKLAEGHICSRLKQVSKRINLPYNSVAIRSQKTLWGSCSGKKNISLNYKLLFLEPHVVDYVLIHELCHTVYMNHSDQFWRLVSKFQPQYKEIDKSLNQAWKIVPAWLEP